MTLRVVMDCDPGTDDAVAMTILLGADGLEVLGFTTVGGKAAVGEVADNAVRLVEALGASCPVFTGSARPLAGGQPYGSAAFHPSGRGRHRRPGLGLPPAVGTALPGAVEFLIDTFGSSDSSDVALVATGPLTNIAAALLRQPKLSRAISQLILMGGARGRGNATASAEFNFWADPLAAQTVLRAGLAQLTIVPLDTTLQSRLTEDDCRAFASTGRAGELVAGLVRHRIAHSAGASADSAPVHDAVCAACLTGDVGRSAERHDVDVEVGGLSTRGRLVIDLQLAPRSRGTASVVRSVDRDLVAATVLDAVRRLG